jgi:hypothetical protein
MKEEDYNQNLHNNMLQGQFDAAVLLSFFKGMSVTAGRFFGNET